MIKISPPIKGISLKRLPQGNVSQFFAENLNPLYAGLGLKGHNGIDFAVFNGTPVLAAHDGTAVTVSNDINTTFTKGFGVWVLHDEGWFTVYWHMLSPTIKVGTRVKAGDLIGYSDNSGASTGPHLHFGLYPKDSDKNNGFGGAIDPLPYLNIGLLQKLVELYKQLLLLYK